MIDTIISGGQTGADQAFLRFAARTGLKTGGWAPKHYRTEAGQARWLGTEYGLKEHPEKRYSGRTLANVREGDLTLIVGMPSSGCNLTQQFCGAQWEGKPWLWIKWPDYPADQQDDARLVREWLACYPAATILNGAGNREEKNPGIGAYTEDLLTRVFIF